MPFRLLTCSLFSVQDGQTTYYWKCVFFLQCSLSITFKYCLWTGRNLPDKGAEGKVTVQNNTHRIPTANIMEIHIL